VNLDPLQLEILDLEAILVHEWYDNQRTWPLSQRLQQSGILRNPPIVTPTQDNSQGYIVLDGANRVAALRVLGFPHILAQVVQPRDPGLRLRTWNHVVLDIDPEKLIAALREIPGLSLSSSEDPYIDLPSQREVGVSIIQTRDGKVYALSAPDSGLHGRIEILNSVVNCYRDIARLDRTSFNDVAPLHPLFPTLSALVIFPRFDILELIQLASTSWLLPPGITRTTVSPRALNVNLPLELLLSKDSLQEKNAALQEMLRLRFNQGRAKLYIEPTVFFDE
jgi:L-serine kinase (ATP) / ParB family transcriptional regulator, heme-responsive regulator